MAETQTHNLPDDDALFTTEDVASRYRVHPRTVQELVKDKKIPAPVPGWPGNTKRWLKSEVVAHIRAMKSAETKQQAS